MKIPMRAALLAALLVPAMPALAVEGTFVLDDGSYSITVEEDGANLVVVEPNKRLVYAPAGDSSYRFHNDVTGSDFYLRVLDDDRLEAGRVPQTGAPSILKRVDTAGAMAAMEANTALTDIAEAYAERAQSEPDNAQAWSFCSAVAFKRAMGEGEEAARFARQSAEVLRSILVGTANPCPDAIPPQYW
ncbi:MAG TPA: hypothetical protein VIG68_05730 [Lysobacter sp.]